MKNHRFFLPVFFCSLLISAASGQTSPNGYHYVKHTDTKGISPKVGEYAFVHICVFRDDTLINSTYEMGNTVPILTPDIASMPEEQRGVGRANPITDVLALMGVGDSLTVAIPLDSSMRLNPELKDAKKLEYSVVLVEVMTKDAYEIYKETKNAKQEAEEAKYKVREEPTAKLLADILADYNAGNLEGKIKKTPSGLKYLVLKEGEGPKPKTGQEIEVSYYGVLALSGKEFDNSYKRGETFQFTIGKGYVIAGWDEGLALLPEGSKAVLFIPAKLGYGAEGNEPMIPRNSELAFFVDVEKIK